MNTKKERQLDMLHGSIWDKLPRFAFPVAAAAIGLVLLTGGSLSRCSATVPPAGLPRPPSMNDLPKTAKPFVLSRGKGLCRFLYRSLGGASLPPKMRSSMSYSIPTPPCTYKPVYAPRREV